MNNDGLSDIVTINDTKITVIRNDGMMRFKEQTDTLHLVYHGWMNGVVLYDFNRDGKVDILLASSLSGIALYIYENKGDFQFEEHKIFQAPATSNGFSRPVILDYNHDGKVDIFLTSWQLLKVQSTESFIDKPFKENFYNNDFLLKNMDSFHFRDMSDSFSFRYAYPDQSSWEAISSDLNQDGWADLYITSDYNIPVYLLFNQKGKSFRNQNDLMQRTSYFSMGSDAADINNDGILDVITLDMRQNGNKNMKETIYEIPYNWQILSNELGYDIQKQQVKNSLQFGSKSGYYSEIAELAGIDATDWSWGVIAADFDNNTTKDLIITSGIPKEYQYKIDYPLLRDTINSFTASQIILFDSINISSHYWFFKNEGNSTFSNKSNEWYLQPTNTISYGSTYADMDNDGDLDLIIENFNAPPSLLENHTDTSLHRFIRIKLVDSMNNSTVHSSARIFYGNGKQQFFELQPERGFYSTSENIIHFGLDTFRNIDSLTIQWTNGRTYKRVNMRTNQVITISDFDNSSEMKLIRRETLNVK